MQCAGCFLKTRAAGDFQWRSQARQQTQGRGQFLQARSENRHTTGVARFLLGSAPVGHHRRDEAGEHTVHLPLDARVHDDSSDVVLRKAFGPGMASGSSG